MIRTDLEELIRQALIEEVLTSPKPGLVDLFDNGAHKDMDVETFRKSSEAIAPYLSEMAETGYLEENPDLIFPKIRTIGIEAEKAMFEATAGINTHKGAIFTLGVILASYGYCLRNKEVSREEVFSTVIRLTYDHLQKDFEKMKKNAPETKGEILFEQYKETGVRGQCMAGYPVIRKAYDFYKNDSHPETQRRLRALLLSVSLLNDTNVVSRSCYEKLEELQGRSREILENWNDEWESRLTDLNRWCIEENISPGGSADVLAAVLLLDKLKI